MNGLHLLEATKFMAFWYQLRNGSLVECSGNQQNDIVNHVTVGNVVKESGTITYRVITHMLELSDKFLFKIIVDLADLQWTRDIG